VSEFLEAAKQSINKCTNEEVVILHDFLRGRLPQHSLEREWGVGAEIILSAISRSSDLTKRGVRGIIAEAVFERNVLGRLRGWEAMSFVDDRPYDFLIRSESPHAREVRIQVKLQRMRQGQPMLASQANRHYPADMYVVEVQKTRGGIDLQTNEETRPYRFGEFDVLAVNMHPSSREWTRFLYTVSGWLIPRNPNTALIEIFQPVSMLPSEYWTDDLETCLRWLSSGQNKKVFDIDPQFLLRRSRKPKPHRPNKKKSKKKQS
jgi:hypothetical protein